MVHRYGADASARAGAQRDGGNRARAGRGGGAGAHGADARERALESERYASGGFSRIIIADCGMDEDAQRVAQLLCRESFDVTVCPQGDLARQFD